MRRSAFHSFLLSAALAVCPSVSNAFLPGHLNAFAAGYADREFLWINPANMAAGWDSSGLEAGCAGQFNSGSYAASLHLPRGISAGFAFASAPSEDYAYYYYSQPEPFTVFALAKRGWGDSPWLAGLSLGLATRVIPPDEYREERSGTTWTLEPGLSWDSPAWEAGALRLGVFGLQTSSGIAKLRLVGLQARWRDASGLWDAEGSTGVLDTREYGPRNGYYGSSVSAPTNRLALAFHLGWFDVGCQGLPSETAIGPLLRLNIPTRTYLRQLAFQGGAYFWSRDGYPKAAADFGLRATFRFRRTPDMARTYAEYRTRMPASARPGTDPLGPGAETPGPAVDTAAASGRTAALDQRTWEERQAMYRDEKIGIWRGRVWPYVNTFGYLTTFLVPAGTSCLGVGDFGPGFLLMGGWALAASSLFWADDPETAGVIYGWGQIGLKLTDLIVSQRFVNRHNRELRNRLRIGAAPLPEGGALWAGLSF